MAGKYAIYGACPTCLAKPGKPCYRPSGHAVYPPHATRPTRWPCPACGLPVLERDYCQWDGRRFTHDRCSTTTTTDDDAQLAIV